MLCCSFDLSSTMEEFDKVYLKMHVGSTVTTFVIKAGKLGTR